MKKLCAVSMAVTLLVFAGSARGFEELPYDCDEGGLPRWSASPEYLLDARPFNTMAGLGSFFLSVHETFEGVNRVEGTTARANVSSDLFTLEPTMGIDPLGLGTQDPTSEVMFGRIFPGAVGYGPIVWSAESCEIIAGDIVLTDQDPYDDDQPYFWAFAAPGEYGDPYWNANHCVGDLRRSEPPCGDLPEFGRYARPVILHELLHNFGLGHVPDRYAHMNYGIPPWLNAADSDHIEPLGDDRDGLRLLYNTTSTQSDVAVANTWFIPQSNGPADQERLCRPSPGGLWNDNFDWFCGRPNPLTAIPQARPLDFMEEDHEPETPEICPGDILRTRYATTNLGTTNVQATELLWFSLDEDLGGGDHISPDSFTRTLCDGCSRLRSRVYRSPHDLPYDTEFFVLAHLDPSSTDEDLQNNAIPLRGKVRTRSYWECNFDEIELVPR